MYASSKKNPISYFNLTFFFLTDSLWNHSDNRVSIMYVKFQKGSSGPSKMVN